LRITLRPSGYAICALLAGTLVGGLFAAQGGALELLALWVLADLALGAYLAGLLDASSGLPWAASAHRDGWRGLLTAAICGALAVLIAGWFGGPIRYLTAGGLVLGAIAALGGARSPERDAAPLLVGLQVLIAWLLGLARTAPWQSPLLLLGLAAGLGTWLRLRYRTAPGRVTLWATRLVWAAWAGMLLAARQPLLGGLVAVTGLADDLYRLSPRQQGLTETLLNLGWLGTWLLVAVATTHWGALV
jgi:hypothetical protein